MGCRKELEARRILPTDEDPLCFVSPQWGGAAAERPVWFALYRLTTAVLLPLWVCSDLMLETSTYFQGTAGVWFLYATNWAFLLLGVSNVLHAVIVIHHYVRSAAAPPASAADAGTDPLPVAYSVFWVVYTTSANSVLIVTASFWVFVLFLRTDDYMSSDMSEVKHSLSGVYVVLDLLLTRTPVRFLHFVYPVLVGLVYAAFNALYFLNSGVGYEGKPYTYYVLYWGRPAEAIATTVLETLLAVFMQLLLVLLCRLRTWLHGRVGADCGGCLPGSGCSACGGSGGGTPGGCGARCDACSDPAEEQLLLEGAAPADGRGGAAQYDSTQQ